MRGKLVAKAREVRGGRCDFSTYKKALAGVGKVVCAVSWGRRINMKTGEDCQGKRDFRGGAGEGRYQNSQKYVTPATVQSKTSDTHLLSLPAVLILSVQTLSLPSHHSFPLNSPSQLATLFLLTLFLNPPLFSFDSPLRWAPLSPRCSTPPPPAALTVRAPLP